MLQIGQIAPDFTADTTQGKIHFHEWIDGLVGGAVLAPQGFHPGLHHRARLGRAAEGRVRQARRQGHRPVGRPVADHVRWEKDIEETQGVAVNFPMIGDTDLSIAKAWGMLPAATPGSSAGRTPADNQTVRTVFVIAPDKTIKLQLAYPMTTGRNFDEILRVIDSLQLTAKLKVATPADWKQGGDVIITGAVSDEEAKTRFPQGWRTPKPYMRVVKL
jgi:alkyl hydroperoxide reductase subunit AhpC